MPNPLPQKIQVTVPFLVIELFLSVEVKTYIALLSIVSLVGASF